MAESTSFPEAAEQPPPGGDTGMPLSLRPEWADVSVAEYLPAPTDQLAQLPAVSGSDADHHPDPGAATHRSVVEIRYDPDDAETLTYFRAVVARGETSARALQLTEEVIGVNPAHYTAWEWRWRCLQALGRDPASEAAFLRRCMTENPKNYQLWNYRRRIALAIGPSCAEEELAAAAAVLALDAKNYHTWAHRQALVAAWGLLDEEMTFAEAAIADDVRNNSAWNQRFFILTHRLNSDTGASPCSAAGSQPSAYDRAAVTELPFVTATLWRAADNDASWAYLRGLTGLPGGSEALVHDQRLPQLCFQALERSPSCVPALAMLLDIYQAQAAAARLQLEPAAAEEATQLADEVLEQLRIADPMRQGYWDYRRHMLEATA